MEEVGEIHFKSSFHRYFVVIGRNCCSLSVSKKSELIILRLVVDEEEHLRIRKAKQN